MVENISDQTAPKSGFREENVKTFKDLVKEVHERGLCGSCGGCVSFCSAHELNAIKMGEEGVPIFENEDNCLRCGICYFICPQIKVLDEELERKYEWKPPIGHFRKVNIAQAADERIKNKGTDGGVVTALLGYMLDKNIIDGAIVSRKIGTPFEREPIVATDMDGLLSAAGSAFSDIGHLEELGKYNTYSPNLFALRTLKNMDLARIAMVGTPCQIQTIRKMQILGILPSHVVKFVIGLFCMENFSFDQESREEFEKEVGLDLADVAKMNIKENIIFDLSDGKRAEVSFQEIEPLVRMACLACTDFANDLADVSVGGLGAPEGYTTVLLRSENGARMFDEAVKNGWIRPHPVKKRKDWNLRRTKVLAKIINFGERKRERGREWLETLEKREDLANAEGS